MNRRQQGAGVWEEETSATKEKSLRVKERGAGLRTRNRFNMVAVQTSKEQNDEG